MPALIVTVDEESLCKDIKNLVRNTVEETPNAILVAGRLFRQVDLSKILAQSLYGWNYLSLTNYCYRLISL